jgi:PAS domain S-box-containing protein
MERPTPKDVERLVPEDMFIVSKTDPRGVITYANEVFIEVSGYTEEELIGKPHNIIRHPDMPRTAFKLLWDTIKSGREFWGYVKNMAKDGSYYWVFAHVTPTFDSSGNIVGYQSDRRPVMNRELLKNVIEPLYAKIRSAEAVGGIPAGMEVLKSALGDKDYEEFIFTVTFGEILK